MMIIKMPDNFTPSKGQLTIIALLEHSEEFKQLIWMVRGRWGIVSDDLETKEKPSGAAESIYETFFETRKYPRLTLAKLRQSLISSKEFEFHPLYYSKLYEQYVREISLEMSNFMRSFKIPRSWVLPLVEFVLTGEMALTKDTEPIFYSTNADGSISVALAANVSRNALDEWLNDNWPNIKNSLQGNHLPPYREPKIENLELYKEAYRLRYLGYPWMPYKQVAEHLDKSFQRKDGISYQNAKEFVSEYEKHLNGLIIG
jgi:hypothetical protein